MKFMKKAKRQNEINNQTLDSIKSEDDNQYALNFTDKLINLTQDCIPHKQVRIRPQDLPWINGTIRKLMRKRNRL